MKKIGFITGIKKEAIILQKITNSAESEIIWVGNKHGSAYTQANTLAKNGCEILISFGFAGALDPQLSGGDLVIPTSVTDAEGNAYTTDYKLHQKVSRHLSNNFKITVGKLFGSETIIWDADEKNRLFSQYNAKIVDMESLGVARAASENHCYFLIVRAVSDTANQSLPKESLKSINLNNNIKIINILIDLTKNIDELPSLLRLAQNSRKAHICLRNVAKLGFGI